ncbi:hypothetical protein CCACVL1_19666 [Corchorus capsularis]|uniref:Uncharacterized protein n=1 Tax=Corchorus capsularis TaxID=210143 RepID=A0A1R3HFC5_COCAP|nr:hypothetical protein CCACVL1_19666 [Corchorus capsularis]
MSSVCGETAGHIDAPIRDELANETRWMHFGTNQNPPRQRKPLVLTSSLMDLNRKTNELKYLASLCMKPNQLK